MARLLDPWDVGARRARNRIVFGPHETNLGRRRAISDRHVAYYQRRAAGGAGVIVVEEASVHPSDWPYERAPLATECVDGWSAVARAVQAEGALALGALGHAGGQGSSAFSQLPLWAPSRVPEVNTREVPKWMETEDIAAVVEGFSRAAESAVGAGLDGVEVNAGQHSLIRQFLSGLTNLRSDEWGEDRSRLARQVLSAVREAVGPDRVVGLRLSCDELAPWAGLVPEAAAVVATELAQWIDYLTVVRGSIFSVSATRPDGHTEAGFNLPLLGPLRSALPPSVSVVAQGSIISRPLADAALEAGADAVEMTRAQVADPDLAVSFAAGRSPRPCVLCNQACQVRDNRNPIVSCIGEPGSGHETEDPPVPAGGPDHPSPVPSGAEPVVLVVGAGPAGLEAARVAALGGRRVRLVEERNHCGGMLRIAARGAGRALMSDLTDWLEQECRRLEVDIELGHRVSAAEVQDHFGPVVLATGSRPGEAAYELDQGALVVPAATFLESAVPSSGVWAVWDPIGGPIGVSVAETLVAAGVRVHLITPDLIPGNELARTGDLAPANARLQAAGVALERRSRLRGVEPGRLRLEDRFSGAERYLAVDGLVDAGYRLPEDELWRQSGGASVRVGDAVAPRSVYEAVLEGRRAGLALVESTRREMVGL